MTYTYKISTGELSENGTYIAQGYSGYGEHKNNPDSTNLSDLGPIPAGIWIMGTSFDSPEHGPLCIHLSPETGTETYGRSGFLIHGDSLKHPGEASKGCIILPRATRQEMFLSDDKILNVIP